MEKWDPLKDVYTLRERVNKLFEDIPAYGRNTESAVWMPAVDIYETVEDFVVKVDLPDVVDSDVGVSVEEHVLRISGRRKLLKEGRKYHQVERSFGAFSRSFVLPDVVDTEGIKAKLNDGILKVRLPKRHNPSDGPARKIEIK